MNNIVIQDVQGFDYNNENKPYATIQIFCNLDKDDKRIIEAQLDMCEEDIADNDYNKHVVGYVSYYTLDKDINKNIELYYLNGYTSPQYFGSATLQEYEVIKRRIIENKQEVLRILKANKLISKDEEEIFNK